MRTRINVRRVWRQIANLSLFVMIAAALDATPPFGFSSQTYRGQIAGNIQATQWDTSPLFSLLIQSGTSPEWGYDVVQGTTEFAALDVTGRPSQSGWHDHPTALSIGLVVQGTVWSHERSNLKCLRTIPTGSVFFERSGEIHNNYNLDPRTPAIVRIIHFVERGQPATRRDQPDPVTGDPAVASPPPAPCPVESAAIPAALNADPLWMGVLSGNSPRNSHAGSPVKLLARTREAPDIALEPGRKPGHLGSGGAVRDDVVEVGVGIAHRKIADGQIRTAPALALNAVAERA